MDSEAEGMRGLDVARVRFMLASSLIIIASKSYFSYFNGLVYLILDLLLLNTLCALPISLSLIHLVIAILAIPTFV
jgi:hypothetical protein